MCAIKLVCHQYPKSSHLCGHHVLNVGRLIFVGNFGDVSEPLAVVFYPKSEVGVNSRIVRLDMRLLDLGLCLSLTKTYIHDYCSYHQNWHLSDLKHRRGF